jgi:predicted component of type VI protein secretion system
MLKATAAAVKVKNEDRAKRTRQLILQGEALMARVAAGSVSAKVEWDMTLAGLTRDHDRKAFDLPPLPKPQPQPGPDNQPAANPSGSDPMAVAIARHKRAFNAWEAEQSERNRIELGQAIAGYEKLTGKCLEGLSSSDRVGWGLGDSPGELLKAA